MNYMNSIVLPVPIMAYLKRETRINIVFIMLHLNSVKIIKIQRLVGRGSLWMRKRNA